MKNLSLESVKKYADKIPVNKYVAAIVFFVVITFVIGDSNLLKRISYNNEISRLKNEIEYYSTLKEENQQKLKDLKSNDTDLEKLAREEYQMVKPNEDLYLIVE